MNFSNSIITKVTLLFIFSLICFVLFVLYYVALEKSRIEKLTQTRYETTVLRVENLIQNGNDIEIIMDYLSNAGFFKEENFIAKNENRFFVLYGLNSLIAVSHKEINSHQYIELYDTISDTITLWTDYKEAFDYTKYYFIALIAFITLVFFYIIVLDSLLPLRALQREVCKFSAGNMDIKTISNNDDEIGKLSAEFTKAARKIAGMTKARTLFLRAIMHELKTPITKGFLVLESLESSKSKTRLESIFTRLNEIINSFAVVEKISTNNYKIQNSEFNLIDLMQAVNKMLIIERERPRQVILDNREARIFGDFELMSLAVKNLVDNAFRHSSDKLIRIFTENGDLVVKNEGAPFKNDISEYFEPFFNDGTKSAGKGLGLGMYIIKNTIEAQGYEFAYKYEQNCHYFYIKNCIIP